MNCNTTHYRANSSSVPGDPTPLEEKRWPLDHALVSSVRRVYYPGVKALRLIFYTTSSNPLNLSVEGAGTEFKLKASPLAMRALRPGVPGKPGTRKIVVIDPGHGGLSTGAQTSRTVNGRHYYEKEITLQIGQRLAAMIKQSPNLDCVMTRTTDQDVGLEERIAIAEAAKGDIFVSLHLNASGSRSKSARGFEVYFLSDGTKSANKQIEDLENEGHSMDAGHGAIDPQAKSILGSLANDMAQTRRQESLRVSSLIDSSFRNSGPFSGNSRGVKSAGFRVLLNAAMPAVLVESGFIDNPEDARLVIDPAGQQQIATLLFNSINRYFSQVDPKFQAREVALNSLPAPRPAPAPVAKPAASKPRAAKSAPAKKKSQSSAKSTSGTTRKKK